MKMLSSENRHVSRRGLLCGGAAVAAAAMLPACKDEDKAAAPNASRGRLKQSLVPWCLEKYWKMDALCQVAKDLGCVSVELCDPKDWPTLKKYGLVCAISNSHGFVKGFNTPANHDMCVAKIKEMVDACVAAGCCPSVITFTGFREGIPDDVGAKNTVDGLKKVIGYCEEKKINLVIEMLNSRVDKEMQGHPGYQGDHMDYCIDIIKKVGSPRMKVLFDVYHVQIMDGDVITRIKQYAEYIGHVHTAGVPGRNELDDKQEINYRPIFQTLADVKYAGYVGHEFIPTRDPLQGLKQAVALATV
ncbi:MAG: TIM barrel protein [Planctomycetota bacterium]|nr:TIM barrel protein [Planctomycetota bacterium]